MKKTEDLDQHIDGYDDRHVYSYDMNIWMKRYVARLKGLMQGNTCLELGIGHGVSTSVFSKNFNEYIVIEGSKRMIERYSRLYPDAPVNIIHGYFEEYESEKSYDVILMGYILEHVDDPAFILNKFKRYLSSNGSLYVVVPNGSSLNRRFGLYAGYLKSLDEMSDFDYKCGHKRTFTYESLIDLVNQCGLTVHRSEGIFMKCMTTEQMLSLQLDESIIEGMCNVAVDYPELSASILLELKYST